MVWNQTDVNQLKSQMASGLWKLGPQVRWVLAHRGVEDVGGVPSPWEKTQWPAAASPISQLPRLTPSLLTSHLWPLSWDPTPQKAFLSGPQPLSCESPDSIPRHPGRVPSCRPLPGNIRCPFLPGPAPSPCSHYLLKLPGIQVPMIWPSFILC